jgi:hypothetical protein
LVRLPEVETLQQGDDPVTPPSPVALAAAIMRRDQQLSGDDSKS